MAEKRYQTLTQFLANPFNRGTDVERDAEYTKKYTEFVASNSIRIHAMTSVGGSYYFHIKVPSESKKKEKYEYDVVIRFFTDNPLIKLQSHLRNYYIQFFSNSPSFMYQYAYLYRKEGFLIDILYDKLDADYINTPPEKTNAEMKLQYDKSIYFACRYLDSLKFRYLEKAGPILLKRTLETKFFRQISDFQSIKLDQDLISEERKLSRMIEKKDSKLHIGKEKGNVSKQKMENSKYQAKKEKEEKIRSKPKQVAKPKHHARRSTKK